MTTVTQRIYRDRNGKPTLDREKAVSLLYPEGSEVDEATAKSLPAEALSKQVKSASEDKALKGPANTK